MNAREVIAAAKNYVADVFATEGVFNIGLEELRFRDETATWNVTIGFSRTWDQPLTNAMSGLAPQAPRRRYKRIEINDVSGEVIGMEDRPLAA